MLALSSSVTAKAVETAQTVLHFGLVSLYLLHASSEHPFLVLQYTLALARHARLAPNRRHGAAFLSLSFFGNVQSPS